MPRKAQQGGKRSATPGASYTNRTDLQSQPVRTATGQAYGAAGQQAQSQQVVPLPDNAAAMAKMVQQAAQDPNAAPVAGPSVQQPGPTPGSLGALGDASSRPHEPVTHGAPTGPGAGPEVLDPSALRPNMAAMIAQLAQATGNPSLVSLAQVAQAQQQPPANPQPVAPPQAPPVPATPPMPQGVIPSAT